MCFRLCVLVQVVVMCACMNITVSDNSYIPSSWEMNFKSLGLSSLYNLYNVCLEKDANKSIEECLSTQMVVLLDQMVHRKNIPLTEGAGFIGKRNSLGKSVPALTEASLEASLPRNMDARQGLLDSLMLDKLSDFFKTHTLQVDLPSGRGLKSKWMLLHTEAFRSVFYVKLK